MTRLQALFSSLAVAGSLLIGGGVAAAQGASFHARAEARGNVFGRAQHIRKTGVVESFLYSGRRVRGVVLTDGTHVLLRRFDRMAFRTIRPGSVVTVRGVIFPTGDRRMVRRATVVAMRPSRDTRAAYLRPQPPRPGPAVTPAALTSEARITSVVRNPSGVATTLVLSNGYALVLPPSMQLSLARRDVRVGEMVSFTARVFGANPSTTLTAQAIAFSDGSRFYAYGR